MPRIDGLEVHAEFQSVVKCLLKVSCLCIDYNATPITFIGVLEATKQEDMPVLTRWLEQLSGLLIEKK